MQTRYALLVLPILASSVALARKSPDLKTPSGNTNTRVIAVYKTDINATHGGKVTRNNGIVNKIRTSQPT